MKKRIQLVCMITLLFTLPLMGQVNSHVSWVEIEQAQFFDDLATSTDPVFNFHIEIVTDDTVKRVEVLSPKGKSFEITDSPCNYDSVSRIWICRSPEDGDWEWDYEHEMSTIDELNQYGDGWYRITVIYNSNEWDQTSFWYGVPGTDQHLEMPTQEPVPTHPVPKTEVSSPVTFQWEECTDPNVRAIWSSAWNVDTDEDVQCDGPLPVDATSCGPLSLSEGLWEGEIVFINGYHPVMDEGMVNLDGISYAVTKISEKDYHFTVDRPWISYQVWGGDINYMDEPDWWDYYDNPGAHGYTLLGETDGGTETFYGSYAYYVILSYEPVNIDCIRGSNNIFYQGALQTSCVDDWDNLKGPCDGQYASIGRVECEGKGFVVLTNPGNWTWVSVRTDQGCPFADLSGDCFVDLHDLAIMAQQWFTGSR